MTAMLITDTDSPRLTVCGLGELCSYNGSGVSHVLSILDPGYPDPQDFSDYAPHHRLTLRFHDIIDPVPGQILPEPEHVERLLRFSREVAAEEGDPLRHLLVHCHMGVSRSTAAMTALVAQAAPGADEDEIFAQVVGIRPQAWPNSRMIAMADDLLGRGGRLSAALRRHYAAQIRRRPDIAEMIGRVGRGREIEMAA